MRIKKIYLLAPWIVTLTGVFIINASIHNAAARWITIIAMIAWFLLTRLWNSISMCLVCRDPQDSRPIPYRPFIFAGIVEAFIPVVIVTVLSVLTELAPRTSINWDGIVWTCFIFIVTRGMLGFANHRDAVELTTAD